MLLRLLPWVALLAGWRRPVATRGGSNGAAEPYVNAQWQLTPRLIIYLWNAAVVLPTNEDVVVFGGCTLPSHISEFYDPPVITARTDTQPAI